MQGAIVVVVVLLENENADEKIWCRAKNRESRRRQRQSGLLQKTELQDLELGVVM